VGRKPQSKLMSRRTERSYKADGADKLAQHSKIRCSTLEVNDPAAQQEFTFLLREICASGTAITPGAAIREGRCGSAEVSRGHSTGSYEPGNTPDGLTTREGLNLADSTTRCWTEPGDEAERPSRGSASAGQRRECCYILRDCQEPPDADPHVRWCGGEGGQSSRLPDSAFSSSPAASSAHMASVGPVTSAYVFDSCINVFASAKSQPRTRLVAAMHSMMEAPELRSSPNASSRTWPSANRLRNCLLKSRGYILTPNSRLNRKGATWQVSYN